LSHVFVLVYVVDIAGPSRSAVPSEVSFLPAFEAGAFLSWWCVLSLCCVSLCPWVVPPLLVPPSIQRGPGSCGSIHGHWHVVQPSGGIGGVILMLCVLVLVMGWWVPPLEEWSVTRGSEVIEPSWCVPLYRVYQLSQFRDIDRPVL